MPHMRRILEGEGSVHIIHGADFRITDPQAVRSLVELSAQYGDMAYFVHFDWALATRHMFHPKLYLTTSDYQRYCAIIGSSNITHGGMSGNVEVNAVIRGNRSDPSVSQCLEIFESILASDALMQPDMTFVESYERLHDRTHQSPVTEAPPPELLELYQELIDLYEEQLEGRRYWQPETQIEFLIQAIENLSGDGGTEYVGLDAIYNVARIGACADATVHEGHRFLSRMTAELLLTAPWRSEPPDSLHLLATVLMPHLVVVELISLPTSPRSFTCPEDYFRRVRESPAAQVWGRVRLFPDYVIQKAETVPQQGHADAGVDVQSA